MTDHVATEVERVLRSGGRVLVAGRAPEGNWSRPDAVRPCALPPMPTGITAALRLPWRRFALVTFIDGTECADGSWWLWLMSYLADRVAEDGRLIAAHDPALAAALHPLAGVSGLSAIDTVVEEGQEITCFRRQRRWRGPRAEATARLRMACRVPPPLAIADGEADLATGQITPAGIASGTRTLIRIHGQPVGMVGLPGLLTASDLPTLTDAALTGAVGTSSIPPIVALAPEASAGPPAGGRPSVWYAGPTGGAASGDSADLIRRLAREGGSGGWLVFAPVGCDKADVEQASAAAIAADGDDPAALVGVAMPTALPDTRSGRWRLEELLAPGPIDPPAILARLCDSRCAAIRAEDALSVWPDRAHPLDPLLLAVATLVARGRPVRVAPGFLVRTVAPAEARPVRVVASRARRAGRLERAAMIRIGTLRESGRTPGTGIGSDRAAWPFPLQVGEAGVRALARWGVL